VFTTLIDDPTNPIDKPTNPIDKSTNPIDEATNPIDELTNPIDEATNPIDEATNPIDEATNPIDGSTNPIDGYEMGIYLRTKHFILLPASIAEHTKSDGKSPQRMLRGREKAGDSALPKGEKTFFEYLYKMA